MACNCAQGYNQPFVNRTSCGCQQGYSGPWPYGSGLGRPYGMAYALGGPPMPLMGRLMLGDLIPQGLGPVDKDAQYQFGFNIGYTGVCGIDVAAALEADGLSYNTTAGNIGGYLNPFIAVQGYTKTPWNSGTDLASAILQSITSRDCSIDQTSIQFRVQQSGQQQLTGTPYSATQATSGAPPGAPTTCDWSSMSVGQYIACQLGFSDPIKSATAGVAIGVGAIVAILFLAKR